MTSQSGHERYDAVVIGAGFFGVEIALELRRIGLRRVLVAEREAGIMRRASYVNQARVHNGYHYPRALRTAARSRANFETFVSEYRDAVLHGMRKVYAVAAGSRVSPGQFETFCRSIGAPCAPAPREVRRLFDPGLVEASYVTRELAFCSGRIAQRLEAALAEAGVEMAFGTQASVLGAEAGHVEVQAGSRRLRAGHVVNCTYAGLAGTGVALQAQIRLETAELVLVVPPPELRGLGITVMDGPFFSTMPFPGAKTEGQAGAHSLTHVRYTPHGVVTEDGSGAPRRSNREAMLRDSARYLPCLAQSRVLGSLFETKATLLGNEADDGRPVMVERSPTLPRVVSVLGAKIDNIYDVRSYLRTQDWGMAA